MTGTTVYEDSNIEIKYNPGLGIWDGEYRLYSGEDNTLTDNDFLDKTDMEALRGYFQAEEDKRLNRWRHPDHPDIYARPMNGNPNVVGVVKDNEDGLAYGQFPRDKYMPSKIDPMTIVAHAYFEAHPAPKPWHDAKEGEAWVLTTFNREEPALVTSVRGAEVLRFNSAEYNIPVTSDTITAGYRIHPKEDS